MFFLSSFSRNFDDWLIQNFHRLVIFCLWWDTRSENSVLWQLPIMCTVLLRDLPQLNVPSEEHSNSLLKCHDRSSNPHSADQKHQSLSLVFSTAWPWHDNNYLLVTMCQHGVMVERLREFKFWWLSHQSVGSGPSPDTFVLEQDALTIIASLQPGVLVGGEGRGWHCVRKSNWSATAAQGCILTGSCERLRIVILAHWAGL